MLADQDFAESRGLDPAPRLVSYGIAAVELGQIRTTRLVGAFAAGTIINPRLVCSQY